MPKVSVVIPCYNQGQYLDEAVNSVLNQTYQDFEIIIVNDGSTDEYTNQLLNDYSRPKTKVITTNNQGLSMARNNGINISQGEYILPLDADDKIGTKYLEIAINILDSDSDIGIVYSKAEFFGDLNGIWELPEYKFPEILLGNRIFCSSFFRKSDWKKVGGYKKEMIYGWEDFEFWLSLLELGVKVHRIDEVLFYYRQKQFSMVKNLDLDKQLYLFNVVIDKHKKLYEDNIKFLVAKYISSISEWKNYSSQVISDKDGVIDGLEKSIKEWEVHYNKTVIDKDGVIDGLEKFIKEWEAHYNKTVIAKDDVINGLERSVEEWKNYVNNVIQDKDNIIQDKDNIIQDKDNIIQDKDNIIQDKDNIIQDKDNIIQDKDNIINNLNNELQGIYSSRWWRVITKLKKVLNFILPKNSFRRKIVKYILKPKELFDEIEYRLLLTSSLKLKKKNNKIKTIKKILVLTPYYPTMGGGEKEMAYFCKYFENRFKEAKIDLLVFNFANYDVFSDSYPDITELNKRFNINLERSSLLKIRLDKNKNWKIRELKNKLMIEKLTKKYDIFLNFMFLSNHRGLAKFNLYRTMFPVEKMSYSYIDDYNIKNILDTNYIEVYDFFISNSNFTNYWHSKFWDKNEKNITIYPPVFSESEINGRYIKENKKNIILSVGRFQVGGHNKKQDRMVDFFINNYESLRGFEYHIVGGMPEDQDTKNFVENIRSKIGNFPVFLHINCPYAELINLYEKAKIFWHATGFEENENKNPEKMEHFGITTVEAMSYGVIPVVINKGGQPEIIDHGNNGFLWNNESECIEHTIRVIGNDVLRDQMALKATQRAYDFSIEEFYNKNKEIIDKLLKI